MQFTSVYDVSVWWLTTLVNAQECFWNTREGARITYFLVFLKRPAFSQRGFFFYAVAGFCEKEKAILDKNVGYNHQMFTKMGNSEQGKKRMEMGANLYLHLTYVFLLPIPFFVPIFHFSLSVPRSLFPVPCSSF